MVRLSYYMKAHEGMFWYEKKFRFKSGSPVPYIEQAAQDPPHFLLL